MVTLLLSDGSLARTPRLPGKLSATIRKYEKAHGVTVRAATAPRRKVVS